MPTISSGIVGDSNLFNLHPIVEADIRREVFELLVPGEEFVAAFKTIRDQVIFTNKRIFVVNVQGITGKKIAYMSYPYSKVQFYGIETAGLLDIDSELVLHFSNGSALTFDFGAGVDIRRINRIISDFIL